ncbi:MAG: cell division protein FtsZ [Candidatus Fimivivens sp.]|nr:cell division protein FtsZ [Candidatus Fimivivens sp.]
MQMNFGMVPEHEQSTVIKVIGVGGGGGNAVNRMVLSGMKGVEFISMNTDYQALATSHATYKLNIGARLTKGKGAGGQADVGQRSAEESRDEITALLKGADMVFVTAGMGGGTGTGAAPVVAEIARGMDILTVGVVTKPFKFEGKRRMEHAEMGITALREHVDALLIIPNERLQQISTEKITLANAFAAADEVLRQGVQSISDLICTTGIINLDFADVTSVMKGAGNAHMGVGRASGKDKARVAAEMAINSPLLETSINGAMGVIANIVASPDIALDEVYTASELISDAAHPDVNLIWGVAYDENLDDEILITVIATGFERADEFGVSNYIKDIAGYKPKDNAAVKASAVQVAPAPAPAVRPAAAPAPEPVVQPQQPNIFAEEETPEEDPYEVIMRMFGRGKK